VTPPAVRDLAYAVHTTTCSYLLDDDGVCQWIVSSQGVVPAHVLQAVGAQFVACLDLSTDGGLIGELRVGAMALLVRHEGDRMVLLRTAAIQNVDDRRSTASEEPTRRAARKSMPLPLTRPLAARQYGKSQGVPYQAAPPPVLATVQRIGGEQTVTWTVSTRTPTGGTQPRATRRK
jgi:hypothetical protein